MLTEYPAAPLILLVEDDSGQPIVILLIEDEPAHAEIVRRNLENI